jgi:hypothetical protein
MSTQESWSKTLTAAGVSDAIPVDLRRFKFGCGIICTMTGTGAYKVQVTGDKGPYVNWNDHDLLQGLTASKNGNLAYPVTAIRLNATSLTGTLTVALVQPIG